jgi:IS4 transposase
MLAFFVSRLKTNTKRRDVVEPIGPMEHRILTDGRLRIGQKTPRGGTINALYDTDLREFRVAQDGKALLVLMTNDHSHPASEIAVLYKERWQIELLFKWIKQNFTIKRFLGRRNIY